MILLRQIRQCLLSVGLILLISTAATFNFVSGETWATTSFMPGMDQSHTQVASMDQVKMMTKNIEGKAQEAIGNMTGDSKNQLAGKAKQVEASTRKAINDSIENPNYQPGRKTKQAERQIHQAQEAMQTEVRKAVK
jgi:uncharacterized protein YjbJ (UPF0337 family)